MGQALQRIQRGAAAQLGELPAAHHLQQLHGEFDLADATARELDVVGTLGCPALRLDAWSRIWLCSERNASNTL